jgi:hypothetical protein
MTQKKILLVGFDFSIEGCRSCSWGEQINPVDFDIGFFNTESLTPEAISYFSQNYLTDLKKIIQESQFKNDFEIYCLYSKPHTTNRHPFNPSENNDDIANNYSWLPVAPKFREVAPFDSVVIETGGGKFKQFYGTFSLEHDVELLSNTGVPTALSSNRTTGWITNIAITDVYIRSKLNREICFDVRWSVIEYHQHVGKTKTIIQPTHPIHFFPNTTRAEELIRLILSESIESEIPEWLNGIKLLQENELVSEIVQIDAEIQERVERKNELSEEVRKFQKPKSILFETGKPLEKAVSLVFEELGLPLMKPQNSAIEDRYFDVEGVRIYIEIRGKEKENFLEKDLNQLIQRIADQQTHPTYPLRGIFVFNHQRLQDPSARTNSFEQNITKKAEAFGICLLDTVTLFDLYKSNKEGAEFSFLELLKNTTGIFKYEV